MALICSDEYGKCVCRRDQVNRWTQLRQHQSLRVIWSFLSILLYRAINIKMGIFFILRLVIAQYRKIKWIGSFLLAFISNQCMWLKLIELIFNQKHKLWTDNILANELAWFEFLRQILLSTSLIISLLYFCLLIDCQFLSSL